MFSKRVRGGERNTVINDVGAIIVVVFTISEISYLVIGLLSDLVRPLCFDACDFKFFGYTVRFNSAVAKKDAMPSPMH